MTEFRKAKGEAVEPFATKWDNCTLKRTDKPYRQQKGSGRSEVLAMAEDGMTLGALAKKAALAGFDSNFVMSAVKKQHDTKDAGWQIIPPSGQTLEQIVNQRQERQLSPEKQAEKEAKAKEREEQKAKKQAEKDAKKKAADDEKAKKDAEKKAAKEKAAADAEAKKLAAAATSGAKDKESAKAEKPPATKSAGKKK
jgi:Mg-chelatase subunit ChlI